MRLTDIVSLNDMVRLTDIVSLTDIVTLTDIISLTDIMRLTGIISLTNANMTETKQIENYSYCTIRAVLIQHSAVCDNYGVSPLVNGEHGEVQLVLGLEHELLLRHVQQRRRSEGSAEGEERQHRLLRLPVLALKDPDPATDVQTLPNEGIPSSEMVCTGASHTIHAMERIHMDCFISCSYFAILVPSLGR